LSGSFRKINDHAVAPSYDGIILPVEVVICTTKELVPFSIDIGYHINGLGVVATIACFFNFQFMIDKRIAAGKKKTGTNNRKCVSHN
jgi:hypothetical protein